MYEGIFSFSATLKIFTSSKIMYQTVKLHIVLKVPSFPIPFLDKDKYRSIHFLSNTI